MAQMILIIYIAQYGKNYMLRALHKNYANDLLNKYVFKFIHLFIWIKNLSYGDMFRESRGIIPGYWSNNRNTIVQIWFGMIAFEQTQEV